MSKLFEKLQSNLIKARKRKDSVEKGILQVLISEINTKAKAPNRKSQEITDNEVISSIKSWIKKTNDCIDISMKNNKDYTNNQREKEILEALLPEQLSEKQLQDEINNIFKNLFSDSEIDYNDTKNKIVGMILPELDKQFQGLYDKKLAVDLIKNTNGDI